MWSSAAVNRDSEMAGRLPAICLHASYAQPAIRLRASYTKPYAKPAFELAADRAIRLSVCYAKPAIQRAADRAMSLRACH